MGRGGHLTNHKEGVSGISKATRVTHSIEKPAHIKEGGKGEGLKQF